jgi:hypothetical protein
VQIGKSEVVSEFVNRVEVFVEQSSEAGIEVVVVGVELSKPRKRLFELSLEKEKNKCLLKYQVVKIALTRLRMLHKTDAGIFGSLIVIDGASASLNFSAKLSERDTSTSECAQTFSSF